MLFTLVLPLIIQENNYLFVLFSSLLSIMLFGCLMYVLHFCHFPNNERIIDKLNEIVERGQMGPTFAEVEGEDAQKLGEVKGTFKGNTSTSSDEIFHGSI